MIIKESTINKWLVTASISVVSASCGGQKVTESQRIDEVDAFQVTAAKTVVQNDSVSNAMLSFESSLTKLDHVDNNVIDSIHILNSSDGVKSIKIYGVTAETRRIDASNTRRMDSGYSVKLGDKFTYSSIEANAKSQFQTDSKKRARVTKSKAIRLAGWMCVSVLVAYFFLPRILRLLKRHIH